MALKKRCQQGHFRSHPHFRKFFLLVCIVVFGLVSCAEKEERSLVRPEKNPYFFDDHDRESLLTSLNRHLDYLKSKKSSYLLTIDGNNYSRDELQESLLLFVDLVRSSPTAWDLNKKIRKHFTIHQAAGRKNRPKGEMLITGYFEPLFEGSLKRTDEYRYPIYSVPENLITKRPENGRKQIGRFDHSGAFVPYWSRKEIEELGVARGNELVYLKDPLDAFLLHVQGSGKIRLDSGNIRKIRFSGSNGLGYNSIGKLLADEGKIERKKVSIPTIRAYLNNNPEDRQRIFHHNPRFIFFQWGKSDQVIGSLGKGLTAGRSIAIDHSVLPTGAVGFLIGRMPVVNRQGKIVRWIRMSRFVLPQDSGSAIQGAGRADLFMGNGTFARVAAGNMNEKGQLYFLIKKRTKKSSITP